MKITFLDPPNFLGKKQIERVFGCTYSLYPMPNIFLLSCAALLANKGFLVRYLDMANEGWNKAKFKDFLSSDESDVYVLHSVNLSIQADIFVHGLIREAKNNVFIVFTGPAPTYFPQDFLKDSNTFVIRGEPEEALLELASTLKEGRAPNAIEGISFASGGIIVENHSRKPKESLDELPYPARYLLKRSLYYNPKLPHRPFTALQTSRNCSYRCIFCVPNSYNFARELEYRRYNQNKKPPVRMRSADSVIEEFRMLSRDGYRSVSIIDDQFLWDEARTINICRGIKGLNMEWGCLARVDRINEFVASNMAQAGCRYVDLGVESFNQQILDEVRKDLKIEAIPAAIAILKKHKILIKINLILGISPLQTKSEIREDIRKARKLDVDAAMFSLATPFPGTDFYDRAKNNNWFVQTDYHPESVQTRAIISYPGLSARELNRLVRLANLSFYFNPGFILKNLKRLSSPLNFYYGLLALKRKFD
jgi:radical SAM superfamily enzyme YgiQ (UPF0313 family)